MLWERIVAGMNCRGYELTGNELSRERIVAGAKCRGNELSRERIAGNELSGNELTGSHVKLHVRLPVHVLVRISHNFYE